MTDVWKSNARKFCEICKVWFADNKVSIEHHESGKKHKAAIQAKLRELEKQCRDKEKASSSLQATLAMMESAARSSMASNTNAHSDSHNLPCGTIGPMPKPRSYLDPRAHTSSLAEMARELARRKQEQDEERRNASKSKHWKSEDDEEQVEEEEEVKSKKAKGVPEEEVEETLWVETKADDGAAYFFHMYTGQTSWEAPSSFLTAEQYASKLARMGIESPMGQHTESVPLSTIKEERSEGHDDQNEPSVSAAIPDIADIPTPGAPSETLDPGLSRSEAVAAAAAFKLEDVDIPLPPAPQEESSAVKDVAPTDGDAQMRVKEEPLESFEEERIKQEDPEANDESTATVEDSDNVESASVNLDERKDVGTRIRGPYGAWTKVQRSPPPPKIDLELPLQKEKKRSKVDVEVRPEDVIVFGEKTVSVNLKKSKSGSLEFRKRKTNISARSRDEQ